MSIHIGAPFPFVGPACAACRICKLRPLPGRARWIWCFGCGSQREISEVGHAAVAKGASQTLANLRPAGWTR